MELPKNITQIGAVNPHCKIYVEDYVVSFMKQCNQKAEDRLKAVALYGVKKEEAGITYMFLYGSGNLNYLQRESRHLSQAVLQEVEKLRRKFFGDYTFLGYCLLNGDMPEGIWVYEQGVCRYVEGYARFYEKNDCMLAYMLAERNGEIVPEQVEQEKYEVVKKRQEERRIENEMRKKPVVKNVPQTQAAVEEKSFTKMRWAVAAVFALLCVTGLLSLGEGENPGDVQVAVEQLINSLTEQRLPDEIEMANASAQTGSLVAEGALTDAILKENQAQGNGAGEGQQMPVSGQAVVSVTPVPEITMQPTAVPTVEPTAEPTAEPTPVPTEAPTAVPTEAPTPAPASYIIQYGDTLSAICLRTYGSDQRLEEICKLNQIDDPDDIRVGDKILLPY